MNRDKLFAFLAVFFVFLSLICALLSNHYTGKVMGDSKTDGDAGESVPTQTVPPR